MDKPQHCWKAGGPAQMFSLDGRSLALLRIGLALLILLNLWGQIFTGLASFEASEALFHQIYLGQGVVNNLWILQTGWVLATVVAVLLLLGYRTRWAALVSWGLLLSFYPRLLPQDTAILLVLLFWAIFLPLGATFSIDSALDTAPKPRTQCFFSAATTVFILQVCFIYWFSGDFFSSQLAASSDLGLGGDELLRFWLRLLGPGLLFIPVQNAVVRTLAVFLFCGIHLSFAGSQMIAWVYVVGWLALLPSGLWDGLSQRLGLQRLAQIELYYDQDCGFCKKMVHLIRTFFLLSGAPILPAQPYPQVYVTMQTMNSWIVKGVYGREHYRFEAVIYLVSCSPLWRGFTPLLRWQPVAKLGDHCYRWVASHRRQASVITKPLKFRPLKTDLPGYQQAFVLLAWVLMVSWQVVRNLA